MSVLAAEIPKIRTKLARLRKVASADRRRLTGELRKDLTDIEKYVKIIYGTQAYLAFHELVREYFGDITPTPDGTVAHYFAGCIAADKKNNPCSPACFNSMPSPNSGQCMNRTYIAVENEGNYIFSIPNPIPSKEGHIYLPDFRGFSPEEIRFLSNDGLEKVYLYDYSENPFPGINYPATLDKLPIRNKINYTATSPKTDSGVVWIVGILLFLLLAFFLVVVFRKKNT